MPFLKDSSSLEPFKKPDYAPRSQNEPSQNNKREVLGDSFLGFLKRREAKPAIKKEEVQKVPVEESRGIFDEYGKAPLKYLKKEILRYRAGGLKEPEREALAEDVPSQYETAYKKKISNYAKKLKPANLGLDDKGSDAERKAGIRKAKDRLDELMGKQ